MRKPKRTYTCTKGSENRIENLLEEILHKQGQITYETKRMTGVLSMMLDHWERRDEREFFTRLKSTLKNEKRKDKKNKL